VVTVATAQGLPLAFSDVDGRRARRPARGGERGLGDKVADQQGDAAVQVAERVGQAGTHGHGQQGTAVGGPRSGAEKVRESRWRARLRRGGLLRGRHLWLGGQPPAVLPAQGDEPSRVIDDRTRGEPAAVIGVHETALRGEHATVRGHWSAQV
jgi:hypothetical protein